MLSLIITLTGMSLAQGKPVAIGCIPGGTEVLCNRNHMGSFAPHINGEMICGSTFVIGVVLVHVEKNLQILFAMHELDRKVFLPGTVLTRLAVIAALSSLTNCC